MSSTMKKEHPFQFLLKQYQQSILAIVYGPSTALYSLSVAYVTTPRTPPPIERLHKITTLQTVTTCGIQIKYGLRGKKWNSSQKTDRKRKKNAAEKVGFSYLLSLALLLETRLTRGANKKKEHRPTYTVVPHSCHT